MLSVQIHTTVSYGLVCKHCMCMASDSATFQELPELIVTSRQRATKSIKYSWLKMNRIVQYVWMWT